MNKNVVEKEFEELKNKDYRVFIDREEYEKRLLQCMTSEELDDFLSNSVFSEDKKCHQAVIYGIHIAAMLLSNVNNIICTKKE